MSRYFPEPEKNRRTAKTLKDITISFIRSRLPDFSDKTFKTLGKLYLPMLIVQDLKLVRVAAAIESMFDG